VLSFVVVGGGPTGVEFAGTMNDFLKEVCGAWFTGRCDGLPCFT
jgi:NADH dehydrogenase FAD-containing subunit